MSQEWTQVDEKQLEGSIAAMPTREDVQIPVEEHLIVEISGR